MKVNLQRKNQDVHFEAVNEDGVTVQLDGAPTIGGQNLGARPMQVLLMGLGGCSGIDIVMILKKQRQEIENMSMEIDAERQKDVEPSLFDKIKIHFKMTGNLDAKKVQRAVDLSMQKYCSVAKILEATAIITYTIEVNGQRLDENN